MSSSFEPAIILDEELDIIECNLPLCSHLGYAKDNLVGVPFSSITNNEDLLKCLQANIDEGGLVGTRIKLIASSGQKLETQINWTLHSGNWLALINFQSEPTNGESMSTSKTISLAHSKLEKGKNRLRTWKNYLL